jgi:hypothetical protein
MPKVKKSAPIPNDTTPNQGFEAQRWAAVDAPCGSLDAAEYKHVVLGLIFFQTDFWELGT